MEALISVIIPTYNRAKLLPRSVESVLNQTYGNIELILADDGSTDGTREWILSLKDERVKHVFLNHGGACVARNSGIEMAKGEYIAFQDSDDAWHPDKLEKQMAFMAEKQADAVCNAFFYAGADGKNPQIWPDPTRTDCRVTPQEISRRNLATTGTILAKRKVFETLRFDPEMPRLQDWELAMRIARDFVFWYDSRPVTNLYEQADSISSRPERAIEAAHLFFKKHYAHTVPQNTLNFLEFWMMSDRQLAVYCTEQRQIIKNHHDELVEAYNAKGELTQENAFYKNRIEQMNDELITVYGAKGELTQENAFYKGRLSEAEDSIAALQAQLAQAQQQKQALEQQKQALEQQKQALEQQKQALEQQKQALEQEVEGLKQTAAAMHEELVQVYDAKGTLEQEKIWMTQTLDYARSKPVRWGVKQIIAQIQKK